MRTQFLERDSVDKGHLEYETLVDILKWILERWAVQCIHLNSGLRRKFRTRKIKKKKVFFFFV
jgi:hypothetical protein